VLRCHRATGHAAAQHRQDLRVDQFRSRQHLTPQALSGMRAVGSVITQATASTDASTTITIVLESRNRL